MVEPTTGPPEVPPDQQPVPTDAMLHIELLGNFRVAFSEATIPKTGWRLAKARQMIQLLALSESLSMHREQLIEQLWPHLELSASMNNFHQALHVARRTLADVIPGSSPTQILPLKQQVLSLSPPVPVWIDARVFEQLARAAERSDDIESCYAAVELYKGELLPEDPYEDWLIERRDQLRDRYLGLLLHLATLHEGRGETVPAIDVLRRIVGTESTHEEAHTALIRLYAGTGRRQQALRQYDRLSNILKNELDVEPGQAAEALYATILAEEHPQAGQAAAPAIPPGALFPEIDQVLDSITEFVERTGDFVGRPAELTQLQRALGRVQRGQGDVIFISGEPGIGKTRIVREFAGYAASAGYLTLWGGCYEDEGAPPYWPWVEILRAYGDHNPASMAKLARGTVRDIARLLPEFQGAASTTDDDPQPPPSDADRFRVFDAVTTFLHDIAKETPLVLVLEDLQWADRSSLLLLEFLARNIHRRRLLVVGTLRPVEVDRRHPVVHTLAELTRHELRTRIPLSGLALGEVEQLLETIIGEPAPPYLAEAIHGQTNGNPFFVREILQLLVDEGRLDRPDEVYSWQLAIPHGIQETVDLRIDRLSETAVRLLHAASIAGQTFELDLVAHTIAMPAIDAIEAMEEALLTEIVRESGQPAGAFSFSHAIIRETLYRKLSQSRRSHLHRLFAETIESRRSGQLADYIALIAHHYLSAGVAADVQKATHYIIQAGNQSLARTAYDEAAGFFQRAIDLLSTHSPDEATQQARLLLRLGEAQKRAGDSNTARDTYRQAAGLADRESLDDEFARAAIGYSEASFQAAYYDGDALQLMERAVAKVSDQDSPLAIDAIRRLIDELSIAPPPAGASVERRAELAQRVQQIAATLGDPQYELTAAFAYLMAMRAIQRPEERISLAERIIDLARETGNKQSELLGHSIASGALLEAGDIVGAEAANDRYERLGEALRQPHSRWAALCRRVMFAALRGDFVESERWMAESLAAGERSAPTQSRTVYFTQIAPIRRDQDRANELSAFAHEILEESPGLIFLESNWALLEIAAGRPDNAARFFQRAAENDFQVIVPNQLYFAELTLVAEICAQLRATEHSTTLYQKLIPYQGLNTSGGGNMTSYGSVDLYLGQLAALNGDVSLAIQHLEQAIEFNRRIGARAYEARACLALAGQLDGHQPGTPERRSQIIQRGITLARDVGMPAVERDLMRLAQP